MEGSVSDWETYEHVDPRDSKRKLPPEHVDPVQKMRDGVRVEVLRFLFRNRSYADAQFDEDFIVPEHLAECLQMSVSDVRRALTELVPGGYARGPIVLPRHFWDGSPARYRIGQGRKVAEWSPKGWAEPIWNRDFLVRKPDGRIWRNPPRKVLERAIRKAEKRRRKVDFDGKGFRILRDGNLWREYGEAHGLLRETAPAPQLERHCPRCGTPVKYDRRSKKGRREHGRRKCDAALVRRIMEG